MGGVSALSDSTRAEPEQHKRALGRIGPNALLQVFNVLNDLLGADETKRLAKRAGLGHHIATPPSAMVDERDVVALHQTIRASLSADQADGVFWKAGDRTADYILANRIPKLVQSALRALPAWAASAILLRAIAKNAWTFAGSGRFSFKAGRPAILTLSDCPACFEVYPPGQPCLYYTATFQGLFRALVHPDAQITDQGSTSPGGRQRIFRLDWPA
ncbi:MAG: bacteriochlorophyll 4-vinyl reductase [Rhizobiales bacterium]|nr:bacteriochlorophyll 4-vinyl reductase [Hyphomicrobiales bacterium]MBO6697256.1 bacteriochlorophyll 4-vinyl reductase [Hyphomicrobiales bacterium]MBO6736489.1 bacteriochlorophyll 4-vinyl reductase [Hyphomicrobiales bacterium]MBO6912959.1 bacteriochlorophyll 4-vinyl reductase [Hyphomicrobiales bacterium]MBO6954127.1 bacteriochlorophyll 4-vinyl reductase [Hyphomicrobiales bacterium]